MNWVGGTSLHLGAEQLGLGRVDEPFVGDVGRDRRHVGDDVDEQLAARDSVEPALIDDLDVEAVLLEIMEHLQRVAGLGENVDVLGRPVDAGVARQRIGARDEERDLRLGHQLQHFGIEGLGRRRRLDQRRLALERVHIVHRAPTGGGAARFPKASIRRTRPTHPIVDRFRIFRRSRAAYRRKHA